MNRTQFISYIDDPQVLSGGAVPELESLVKKYPFFQTAHLLYLKALHGQDDILFNNQLKLTAAYAGDRRMLYDLIKKEGRGALRQAQGDGHAQQVKQTEKNTVVVEDKVVEKPSAEVFEQKLEKLVETKLDELSIKLDDATKSIEEKLQKQIDASAVKHVEPPAEEKQEEVVRPVKDIPLVYSIEKSAAANELKENAEKTDLKELGALTKDIINKAIGSSVEIEATRQMFEKRALEQKIKTEIKPEAKPEVKPVQEAPVKDGKMSFTQWLKTTHKPGQEQGIERTQILDIIDKFIKEEPRIKPQTEFFSPDVQAKKSVEPDLEIVTETLADIYLRQKNYGKAITAYKHLSLKYPEKSAFFATRIAEIRRFINQNK